MHEVTHRNKLIKGGLRVLRARVLQDLMLGV